MNKSPCQFPARNEPPLRYVGDNAHLHAIFNSPNNTAAIDARMAEMNARIAAEEQRVFWFSFSLIATLLLLTLLCAYIFNVKNMPAPPDLPVPFIG